MSRWVIGGDEEGYAEYGVAYDYGDPLDWDPGDYEADHDVQYEETWEEDDVWEQEEEPLDNEEQTETYATAAPASESDQNVADCLLFEEGELQSWNGKQAVLWISKAGNEYEVLGLRTRFCSNRSLLRARFRRLSLLVHPDKNDLPEASTCFQRVQEAFQVLSDDVEQNKLLCRLFPEEYVEDCDGTHVGGHVGSFGRAARRRAERSCREGAVFTTEQAEAMARAAKQKIAREVESNEQVKARIFNRRNLESLAPSKKRVRRSSSPLPAGVAAAPTAGDDPLTGCFGVPRGCGSSQLEAAVAAPKELVQSCQRWVCPNCDEPNKVSRENCNNCGAPAPQQSAPASIACSEAPLPPPTQQDPPAVRTPLPSGWEKRESRRKPGLFYYVHLQSGEARLERPHD